MYKRILVPTDGSPLAKKAVDAAVQLAASLGAEVVALNVVPDYPTSCYEGGIDVALSEIARVERMWAEQGQALADDVGRTAEQAGVKAKAVTVRSDLVADAILAAAKKNRCDLVVMASHGRKGIKRLLLGSETEQVLTHGKIPVLVLR